MCVWGGAVPQNSVSKPSTHPLIFLNMLSLASAVAGVLLFAPLERTPLVFSQGSAKGVKGVGM